MNILVPFNDEQFLPAFLESGAKEFYMGFYDPAWTEAFGIHSDINRLSLFRNTANRYTIEELERIAKRLHEAGASLYITMNAPGYSAEQLKWIGDYLDTLSSFQADGIITSIPELIPMIRSRNMKAVASTMCGIMNRDLAKWYREQGMQRIILPRELSSPEIEAIMQAEPELEYEVFFMRNGCHYEDFSCLGMHGGEKGALCYSIRHGNAQIFSRDPYFKTEMVDTHDKFCSEFHSFACGQCAVYRFMDMGVNALKIVGRLDDMDEVLSDIRLTSENLRIASQCDSEEEYLRYMRWPGDPYDYCRRGFSCYYPEIRWS